MAAGDTRVGATRIDVPASLHRDINRQCAEQETKIADVARELLRGWVQRKSWICISVKFRFY